MSTQSEAQGVEGSVGFVPSSCGNDRSASWESTWFAKERAASVQVRCECVCSACVVGVEGGLQHHAYLSRQRLQCRFNFFRFSFYNEVLNLRETDEDRAGRSRHHRCLVANNVFKHKTGGSITILISIRTEKTQGSCTARSASAERVPHPKVLGCAHISPN